MQGGLDHAYVTLYTPAATANWQVSHALPPTAMATVSVITQLGIAFVTVAMVDLHPSATAPNALHCMSYTMVTASPFALAQEIATLLTSTGFATLPPEFANAQRIQMDI